MMKTPTLPLIAEATRRRVVAFTLVELLVVMTITVALLAFVVPSARSVLESSSLTRGGQLVADQIALARQIASARNCTVELRFIQDPAASAAGYSVVQLWRPGPFTVDATTTPTPTPAAGTSLAGMVALDSAHPLPAGIVVAADPTKLSPLLAWLTAGQTMPLPGRPGPFAYVAFQIKPSGEVYPVCNAAGTATAATVMSPVYLTVVPVRYAVATSAPPDFVTVQINPYTGTPSVYRP